MRRTTRNASHKVAWMLVGTGAGIAAASLVRRALEHGWRLATDDEPPSERDIDSRDWKRALAWSVATGAAVSTARLLARRGAAIGWKRAMGRRPPA